MKKKELIPKAKKFLKVNRKTILKITIISVTALVALFIIFNVWLNVHFLLVDDLILEVEPADKSYSVHYFEKPNITVTTTIENSFFCDATCMYEFVEQGCRFRQFHFKGVWQGILQRVWHGN